MNSNAAIMGQGGFGTVRAVTLNCNVYAAKTMSSATHFDYEVRIHKLFMERIVEAQCAYTPQHIAIMHSCNYTTRTIYFELASCDLMTVCLKGHFGEKAIRMIKYLPLCVNELHAKGIIHNDIKPENFLIMEDGRVTLCDLGCACVCDGDEVAVVEGTACYCSPEQLGACYDNKNVVTFESDNYALGTTIFCVACGFNPFDNSGTLSTSEIRKLRMAGFDRDFLRNVERNEPGWEGEWMQAYGLSEVLRGFLRYNPGDRLSLTEGYRMIDI